MQQDYFQANTQTNLESLTEQTRTLEHIPCGLIDCPYKRECIRYLRGEYECCRICLNNRSRRVKDRFKPAPRPCPNPYPVDPNPSPRPWYGEKTRHWIILSHRT